MVLGIGSRLDLTNMDGSACASVSGDPFLYADLFSLPRGADNMAKQYVSAAVVDGGSKIIGFGGRPRTTPMSETFNALFFLGLQMLYH